ncbi:SpoIIE family protein phosphatase [Halocola ammonii]
MPYLLRKSLFVFALALISTSAFSQKVNQDSLLAVADTAEIDSVKVFALLEAAEALIFNSPDSALYFVDRAFDISEEAEFIEGSAKCYNYYGIQSVLEGDNLKGLENFQAAESLFQKAGILLGAAQTTNNIGVIYNKLERHRKAIEQYIASYEIYDSLDNFDGKGTALYNISSNYADVASYDTAMMYIDTLVTLRAIHPEISPAHDLRAEIFYQQDKLDSAEFYFKKTLINGIRENDLAHENDIVLSLADIQIKLGKYGEAEKNLERGIEIAGKNHYWEMAQKYYELNAKLLAAQGNYDAAYISQQRFIELKDSLNKVNNAEQINELNAKYQTAKKDKELAENKRLMAERKAAEEMRNIIFAIVIAAILIVALLSISFLLKQKKSNKLLNLQNEEIKEQRHKIISSINYAKKIQNSILIPEKEIRRILPSSFVFFKPKDIVSGDFYWFSKQEEKIIMAAIDCTGHGVPGAFMSLIANSKLNKVINELQITEPSEMLNVLHTEIVSSLHQNNDEENAQDGMDMSICIIDPNNKKIEFAGAHNSMMLVNGSDITEVKADCLSIGGRLYGDSNFTSKTLDYNPGDKLFLYTDGYIDQFGGENNKKLNKKRFKNLLLEISELSPDGAKDRLDEYLTEWRGATPQLDDILLIGTRLD